MVATERGETSFYGNGCHAVITISDKLHTSYEISGALELVTESPVTVCFSVSLGGGGGGERGGLEWQKGADLQPPSWEDLGWRHVLAFVCCA